MQCLNCYSGEMMTPNDKHPSYMICPSCGAMELLYEPQPYQQAIHEVSYDLAIDGSIKPQIIASFGGGKSHSRH